MKVPFPEETSGYFPGYRDPRIQRYNTEEIHGYMDFGTSVPPGTRKFRMGLLVKENRSWGQRGAKPFPLLTSLSHHMNVSQLFCGKKMHLDI